MERNDCIQTALIRKCHVEEGWVSRWFLAWGISDSCSSLLSLHHAGHHGGPGVHRSVNPLLLRTASRSEDISSLSSCALSQD